MTSKLPTKTQRALIEFAEMVKEVRAWLEEALIENSSVTEFRMELVASGRLVSGDVKVEFRVSPYTFGGDVVKSGNVDHALDEFIRRHQWENAEAPLMLSRFDDVPKDESKPMTYADAEDF